MTRNLIKLKGHGVMIFLESKLLKNWEDYIIMKFFKELEDMILKEEEILQDIEVISLEVQEYY
jgi:hypothetical protein